MSPDPSQHDGWRRHFRVFAARSEPGPQAARRLAGRLRWPGELARSVPREPASGATARLAWRLRERRRGPSLALLFGGAVLLAAAALLIVFWPRPELLDEELAAAEPLSRALTEEVRADYEGTGRVRGTNFAPRLWWDEGRLALDVEPHRGIDLTVETAEATVHVVGTAFSVNRDALGTAVHVERGEVTVRCAGEPIVSLKAGGDALCLPARAAGMLTRAQRLLDVGAPPEQVLDAVERGLRFATEGDPAIGELLTCRMQVLLRLGRDDEARRDAERYLAIGGPRAEEVRAVLSALGGG